MGLDWLQTLLKTLKNLLVGDSEVHMSYNNSSKKVVFKNKGDVNLYQTVVTVPRAQTEDMLEALKVNAFDKDIVFLQDESQKLLNGVNEFEATTEVKSLIKFFTGKIPPTDLLLLRSGLYIAYLRTVGDDAAVRIKNDIRIQYGERGKNIVNLASAGYFKTHIQPLYKQMCDQEGFSNEDFLVEYEKIVTELPFAIFVHQGKSVESILSELEEKVEQQLKYHVANDVIALHGFGPNADIIEHAKVEIEKIYQKITLNSYMSGVKIAILYIYYKTKKKEP